MLESGRECSLTADAIMGDNVNSIKRDSEVWFEDGNVIVVAQDTAFRFHKSVVSLHSSVFRDLFSIPQPESLMGEEVDEKFDGCPVVHVSDTSYDFRELLRAIYGGVSYFHPDQTETFPVLAALARLSHKYQLDQLLASVIHRLKRTFTTQLQAWDNRGGVDGKSLLRLSSPDVIEALNLFRLIDRPDMIPTAVYECARLKPSSLLRGETRADGVTRERLSPSDMELCMDVKEELVQATACLLMRLCEACDARIGTLRVSNAPGGSGCASPGLCVGGLRTVISRCRRDLSECIDADPLCMYYMSAAVSLPLTGEMCRACGDVLKAAYSRERTKIWRSFPKLMGVEVANWDSA
ncbi:hypothetical protein V8D89_002232 [Ganoderma adspersum]